MRFMYLTIIFLFSACTTMVNSNKPTSANTKYYYGDVMISSADGKTPYGKSVSLIKRTVDPAQDMITEIVLQPPRDPKQKPKDINTVLKRVGSTNVFSTSDDANTFNGKLIFTGTEWSWNSWTYDIKLADGSKLNGKGLHDAVGIKTEKTFYKPDGGASLLIREDLKSISSDEYDSRHKQMMGSAQ